MKIAVGIVVVLLAAASFLADYKWRRWMAARRADREQSPDRSRLDQR
jgi:hypothetical protein